MSDFELRVSGKIYTGWTQVQVTRSLEELAHSFSVSVTDLWKDGTKKIPIRGGNSCSVSIGNTRVTTGYIDADNISYDAKQRTLGFSGRSKTGDLVDCTASPGVSEWKDTSLLMIAKALCAPFDIDVTANVSLGEKFRKFTVQEGETSFAALERAARMRGVLPITGDYGNIVLDRRGSSRVETVLEFGKNILTCSQTNSWQERFSSYTIKAQATGSDNFFGSAAAAIKKESVDAGVTRYRPLTVMAENEETGLDLQKRADWERNVRAGRSKRISYSVRGWEHSKGLWKPNRLVKVIDPNLRLDDELLIVSTTQSRGNDGTRTVLELTMPQAFDVQALPEPSVKGTAFWQ